MYHAVNPCLQLDADGRIEERMPFMFLHVPDVFLRRNPQIADRLNENAWRLTCQFDVYETLVDILLKEYGMIGSISQVMFWSVL